MVRLRLKRAATEFYCPTTILTEDKRSAATDITGTARDNTGTTRDKTGTTRDKTGTARGKNRDRGRRKISLPTTCHMSGITCHM